MRDYTQNPIYELIAERAEKTCVLVESNNLTINGARQLLEEIKTLTDRIRFIKAYVNNPDKFYEDYYA